VLDAVGFPVHLIDRTARVVLHGKLRRKFGPELTVGASTPANAIAVLCILKPGFRAMLEEGDYRVVRGSPKRGIDLDLRGLQMRLPPSGEMHIFPVAKGAKRGGAGKIIIGVLLVVAAFAFPATLGALGFSVGTIFGAQVATTVAVFGASMILGGITMMLSPQPQGSTSAAESNTQSFLLGGQLNVQQQGVPVPVQYGRVRVGSVVISVGYEASAIPGDVFNPQVYWNTKPHVYPNTLRSKATVRIIDMLGEGPIQGLVDGPKSIFFDDTPLMAPDGSMNFNGVSWEIRYGYPTQDFVAGYSASEETINVNVQVTQRLGPITQTISSQTATAARVTLKIPALFQAIASTGDQYPYFVQFGIDVRPSKQGDNGWIGDWVNINRYDITGKCTSPYETSYRFDLPRISDGANTWDVRVTRNNADSTDQNIQNDLFFELITVIDDHRLEYPDTAYIALTFDAEAFGTTIPARTYEIYGRLVQVPANYDPVNRTYASSGPGTVGGTWDTVTFKNAVTSNPAWALYDMLSHPRYGCAIPSNSMEVTKADLYVISQYCDEIVPDGYGGFEPRYTVNANVTDQAEAYTMLQTMVSAFRGMTYWGAGQVVVVNDMPKNPVKLINQANVIDGDFNYEGTSLKTRHNVVRVMWRDPANKFQPTPETVELTDDVARRGVIATDLTAWGCTSRSLARRLGKWLLYSETQQTETVNFDASLYNMNMRPGDLFQQHDPLYVGLRSGGRLQQESTTTVLQLDGKVSATLGSSYTLTVVMPDDSVAGQTIMPQQIIDLGDHSAIQLYTPLPQQPTANAEWILLDNTISPRMFQVVSVAQPETGRYQVTAVEYNSAKFDYIEKDILFPPQIFSHLPELLDAAISPPTNVSARDYMTGVGATQILRVTVSWQPPYDPRVAFFQVLVQNATYYNIIQADGVGLDIDNLAPDHYVFSVRSVSSFGGVSIWVSADAVLVDGKVDPPPAPLGLTAVGGTRRVFLNWQNSPRRDIKYTEVQRAPGTSPGSFSTIAYAKGTAFVDADSDVLYPDTTWWYRVRDIALTDVAGDFSNQVSAKTTLLVADDLEDGIINTAKFAQSIKPVMLITSLGDPGEEGDIAFNEVDSQLYQMTNGSWIPFIDFVAIKGTIQAAQIAAIDAVKITGQITETQISDSAITTPKLAAAAVLAGNIAAGAVQALQISSGAVTADKVAALSISSDKLAAQSVILGKVAAGAIGATEIAAEAIKATHLAADFQLTRSAQIGTAVIGHAQIGQLEVGTNNIAFNAVSSVAAGTFSSLSGSQIYVTTDGSPVLVWGTLTASYPGFVQWVERNGVQINTMNFDYSIGGSNVNVPIVPFMVMDYPGSGTFGYRLTNALGAAAGNYTIAAICLKR
jgi:predicted phage tail protein